MPAPKYQPSSAAIAEALAAAIPARPKPPTALTNFLLFSILSSCALRGRNVDDGVDHRDRRIQSERAAVERRDRGVACRRQAGAGRRDDRADHRAASRAVDRRGAADLPEHVLRLRTASEDDA